MDQPTLMTRTRRILLSPALGAVLAVVLLASPNGTVRAEDVPPQSPVTSTAGLLGTCYANYETSDQLVAPLAYDAGSRWDRVDFSWSVLEPMPDSWNFAPHDDLVAQQTSYDLDIVGILMSTPDWAASGCSLSAQSVVPPSQLVAHPSVVLVPNLTDASSTCPPRGLDLDWDHPGNVWGNFVFETVRHYKDDVHVWEMWNEPDLWTWFWQGSVDEYAQLLRVGYQAAKAADPDATVLFAGLAYWANPSYYVAVLDALETMPDAAANNYFFDAMSLHLYSNIYTIRPVAAQIQVNMASRVGPHPIWLTETGVPLWDEWPTGFPAEYKINRATAEEAAAYVVEGFSEARSIGIEKFIFFRTHDEAMSGPGSLPEYFGLIRNDLSLRPAYVAFQTTARYLYGENQITGPFTSSDGVRRVTFWGTPRGRIDVLWNTTGATVTHGHFAVLPEATLVTYRGVTSTVVSDSALLPVTLAPATANTAFDGSFLIGGEPVLLIQEDTTPPVSVLRALEPIVYSPIVTLTWDVADDGAGYWYEEVERASAPAGPWTQVAGWGQPPGTTTVSTTLPAAGDWYFRARARDRAGNWEQWPSAAETSTTAILTRTVSVSVTTFLDDDSDGLWGASESPTETTTVTWRDAAGALIGQNLGATWRYTATVDPGPHTLWARAPGYLISEHRFAVVGGYDPLLVTATLGLRPVHASAYLPIIARRQ